MFLYKETLPFGLVKKMKDLICVTVFCWNLCNGFFLKGIWNPSMQITVSSDVSEKFNCKIFAWRELARRHQPHHRGVKKADVGKHNNYLSTMMNVAARRVISLTSRQVNVARRQLSALVEVTEEFPG